MSIWLPAATTTFASASEQPAGAVVVFLAPESPVAIRFNSKGEGAEQSMLLWVRGAPSGLGVTLCSDFRISEKPCARIVDHLSTVVEVNWETAAADDLDEPISLRIGKSGLFFWGKGQDFMNRDRWCSVDVKTALTDQQNGRGNVRLPDWRLRILAGSSILTITQGNIEMKERLAA